MGKEKGTGKEKWEENGMGKGTVMGKRKVNREKGKGEVKTKG